MLYVVMRILVSKHIITKRQSIVYRYTSVSYTHLDVYKRQVATLTEAYLPSGNASMSLISSEKDICRFLTRAFPIHPTFFTSYHRVHGLDFPLPPLVSICPFIFLNL